MKAAVIGVGRMGRSHGKALKAAGLELVGMADAIPASLQAAQDELGVAADSCFSDPAVMLDTVKPDFVCVATTATSHADLSCLAAEKGARYILCEKPMATSMAECQRMISTCAQYGVRLGINHPTRFMPQYTRVKELIEAGRIGPLCGIHVLAGNCGMAMNGIHFFELLRYLTGEPAEEVLAWFSDEVVPNPRGTQFKDVAGFIRATTATGQRLHIEAMPDTGHGVTFAYMGAYGQIFVDGLTGILRLNTRKPEFHDRPSTQYGMPWDTEEEVLNKADNVVAAKNVIESLIEGAGYPTPDQAMVAVRSLITAYRSAEEGTRLCRVKDTPDSERRFPWA